MPNLFKMGYSIFNPHGAEGKFPGVRQKYPPRESKTKTAFLRRSGQVPQNGDDN